MRKGTGALRWRRAMAAALYGPGGFFVTGGPGPAGHFRTSVHASPLFAGAVLRLVAAVDDALGNPPALDVVDIGAGRGELLGRLMALAPDGLAARLRPLAVEMAARPADLPLEIGWTSTAPAAVSGVLLATEWLDNVPLDVACPGTDGRPRYLLVDPDTGRERAGEPVDPRDAEWLADWWPFPPEVAPPAAGDEPDDTTVDHAGEPGWPRAEVGLTRDTAWAAAVSSVTRGLAVTVDYGHRRGERPLDGTLTAFRGGRQVAPVPDGSCDITAHVAIDAAAEAGGRPYTLLTQREALRALGVSGARPPLEQAYTDPAGYLRALSTASAAAELTDPAGLGGHYWLLHPRGIALAGPLG